MTAEQRADPALSAAVDAWHQACHDGATIEDGMRRVVDAVRAAEVPPLAELVTDEDLDAARNAADLFVVGWASFGGSSALRAALEAYGARLLARHGCTP